MSNPLVQLKKLLSVAQPPEVMKVVSVNDGRLVVVGASGSRSVPSSIQVGVGDFVLVNGDTVQGKVANPSSIPSYYV